MTTNNSIAIQLTSDEKFRVTVGNEVREGDLYYLGIDPRTTDHDCTPIDGLRRLIGSWIEVIIGISHSNVFYLPFDFSDEYTGWLACQKNGSNITIVSGWAEIEGWSFSPSDFREHLLKIESFRPNDPVNPQTFYAPRVLAGLRRSLATLEAGS